MPHSRRNSSRAPSKRDSSKAGSHRSKGSSVFSSNGRHRSQSRSRHSEHGIRTNRPNFWQSCLGIKPEKTFWGGVADAGRSTLEVSRIRDKHKTASEYTQEKYTQASTWAESGWSFAAPKAWAVASGLGSVVTGVCGFGATLLGYVARCGTDAWVGSAAVTRQEDEDEEEGEDDKHRRERRRGDPEDQSSSNAAQGASSAPPSSYQHQSSMQPSTDYVTMSTPGSYPPSSPDGRTGTFAPTSGYNTSGHPNTSGYQSSGPPPMYSQNRSSNMGGYRSGPPMSSKMPETTHGGTTYYTRRDLDKRRF